ncbi:peptidoglycan-binding domain-containing protein [Polaribacter dokdonensis]|uniref:Peptidoglycan binding domain-containing protein n=1 Tax=Polaribacter dokdonensis DSW-5 TaxID=1300348 RepID=A0A0N0CG62_9FLAO|nr:peptidoglycan-binding domain-containing protein [Polaribacter dokdonensis]KOY52877.1 Peptidoglycan-binding domain 1 protein [Polaribacter dokdonensis DSW-5]SEE53788.1 Putative peptidoglycan binding domain-containing protein [Polaribacter dokdonensis DSW-5]
MKQIIIFLLLIIAAVIGYGEYSDYKRYHSPNVDYITDQKIDVNYYNQEFVNNYYKAVEDLNSYVKLQWTVNDIDVRTPEDDDIETTEAVKKYTEKLAEIKFYEAKLNNSLQLKEQGKTNKEIQYLELNGLTLEDYNSQKHAELIKSLFKNKTNLYNGEKNAIIYEVQKKLVDQGESIQIDGVYRIETLNAIKAFEQKNDLLADGYLDELTIELLFQN